MFNTFRAASSTRGAPSRRREERSRRDTPASAFPNAFRVSAPLSGCYGHARRLLRGDRRRRQPGINPATFATDLANYTNVISTTDATYPHTESEPPLKC
jgi:hypothetical protein